MNAKGSLEIESLPTSLAYGLVLKRDIKKHQGLS
jgi:hypothetical protein